MKKVESEKYIKQKLGDYAEFPLADDEQRKTLIHVPLGKLQKAFEDGYECSTKWIDVKDRLPEKNEHVLCVMEYVDGTIDAVIRWRTTWQDVECDSNGFAIYKPLDKVVLAWLPIPSYYNINNK